MLGVCCLFNPDIRDILILMETKKPNSFGNQVPEKDRARHLRGSCDLVPAEARCQVCGESRH